jgi:DNA polymerase III delta prime subunit
MTVYNGSAPFCGVARFSSVKRGALARNNELFFAREVFIEFHSAMERRGNLKEKVKKPAKSLKSSETEILFGSPVDFFLAFFSPRQPFSSKLAIFCWARTPKTTQKQKSNPKIK